MLRMLGAKYVHKNLIYSNNRRIFCIRSQSGSAGTVLKEELKSGQEYLKVAENGIHIEPLGQAKWATHAYKSKPGVSGLEALALEDSNLEELEEPLDVGVKSDMKDEEVEQWINQIKIPDSAFEKCCNEMEVFEVKRRYAKQVRLETSVNDIAVHRYHDIRSTLVHKVKKGSELKSSKQLLNRWFTPLTSAVQHQQLQTKAGKYVEDSSIYGPAFLLMKADAISVISVNHILNQTLADHEGSTFVKLSMGIGRAFMEELLHRQKKYGKEKLWLRIMQSIRNRTTLNKCERYFDAPETWDRRLVLKIGAALMDLVITNCTLPKLDENGNVMYDEDENELTTNAFNHEYYQLDKKRRVGMVRCTPELIKLILSTSDQSNFLPWTARHLPMLVPPKPWTSAHSGGYLTLRESVVRHRDSKWQIQCVRRGSLDEVYDSLNAISAVPWIINKDVYRVIKHIWDNGGGFGDLPTRTDYLPKEEMFDMDTEEGRYACFRLKCKMEKKNRELHGLRCSTVYRLQIADEFLDEEEIYFPYNMDFRGRVYPIPPNLNHLGSDLSRSLLIFKEKKPLGPQGLRWLKIHLSNLCGVNKCSFDDREKFVNENLENVRDSALHPIDGECWWKKADYPFLALGVCFELIRAIDSGDPENFESNIPVHQDGSCNGLQHYAALGRDNPGGYKVNLLPADKPQDVYTSVCDKVIDRMHEDSLLEPDPNVIELPVAPEKPEGKSKAELLKDDDYQQSMKIFEAKYKKYLAYVTRERTIKNSRLLLNRINRKVVKQTVMTSVYGVTYIGARRQIQARLEESMMENQDGLNADWEKDVYSASCYAADVTMASMGDLFTAARDIMSWLSSCAHIVSTQGQQPMSWITPMGLPVVQPYRKTGSIQIKTKLQHVVVSLHDTLAVSVGRQKTAFPPNFVHSLDSAHLMMTSNACSDKNIAFAAVHDSFWSHPCSVDAMNIELRDAFVKLYEQPILEDLLQQLQLRFPNAEFPPLPEYGDLDIKLVKDSKYFFN